MLGAQALSAVSGSDVLFLFNEAAEQVGGGVRASSCRVGVEREATEGVTRICSCRPGFTGRLSRVYWAEVLDID